MEINENTSLLSTSPPLTPQQIINNSDNNNNNENNTSNLLLINLNNKINKISSFLYFFFFLFVILICLLIYSYNIFNSIIIKQQEDIHSLRIDYSNLLNQNYLNKLYYENLNNQTRNYINEITENFNDRIILLENMESNSDVIDELHSTEQAIFKEIEAEKTLVGIIINALQSNVTNAISQSNRLVDRKLSEVDRKVKVSENKMYSLVEETSQNISTSVELAEKHIQVIDQNLTSQMTIMTNSVNLAITSVKNIVDSAKADISKEVEAVHSNMDQYIISTDKKIAAENDFIRYQLAGKSNSSLNILLLLL